MKYYLIAGEASGDLHGSNLMRELKRKDPEARFRFFGGDLMKNQGGTLVKHYREMAFMGFLNVILNLKTIGRNMKFCREDILSFKPDVLVLIDYPGFNLRMAEFAKKNGIKVYYYISPKVWAWKEFRVKKIKQFVDELFTILPFETNFFKKHGVDVNYVGNPLMDSVTAFRKKSLSKQEFLDNNNLDDRPIVALLSGSRRQEVKNTLPVMKKAAACYPEFQFVVAGVNTVDSKLYKSILNGFPIPVIYNQTYDLLNNSYAALVASGTATLETALFGIPQTVLYRVEGGWLLHFIMKNFFLKVKWASLPNLILNKEALKEYLQADLTFKNVKDELHRLLYEQDYRDKIMADYNRLNELMGAPGTSQRAATKMIELIKTV
ncbi:lipid-A-disaccharide synthase [Mariniphaga anaerophila]|uniref:Lipid-A-disaccharide synthase n=1 Tax=Mariniphaga anaerophila TaxID=1484053 RepID=A0A1M4XRA9_9BACT|nr:lipid-A-disaccharide synthase [Mariniphaga anaerophila]SHE95782.1 lipid-A-disaccharide synthase [Mariniphaga anaerophila]